MGRRFDDPEQLMTAWAAAVTDDDPRSLADVFAADAEFVNLFGSIWQGREAIVEGHAWALDGVLSGSTMGFEEIHTRPLGDAAVVMRGVCQRGRAAHATAQTLAPGTTVVVMVARRDRNGWTAVSGANVARQEPGG